ncbi:MAG: hypothetical protein KBD06_00970 [Candidatus Pacebacteria bacterium]|nr:hypothetical protein [Candidatus Paceibacterota bacterium]
MNNEHNQHKKTGRHDSLRDSILSKIKTDRIIMKPRLYFTMQIIAVAFVALCVLLLSVFIFNFILFSIRINSHDAFLQFGPRGLSNFFMFFPWPILMLDIGLVVLFDWLVRKFRFGYRIPMMYLVGAILFLTVVAGFALDRGTYLNDRLMDRAEHEGIPGPLGGLYHGARRAPHDGICRCTIIGINGPILTVSDFRGGATTTFTVILPNDDHRATTTGLSVGDVVFIAGDTEEDGIIRAFGVRKERDRGFKGRLREVLEIEDEEHEMK